MSEFFFLKFPLMILSLSVGTVVAAPAEMTEYPTHYETFPVPTIDFTYWLSLNTRPSAKMGNASHMKTPCSDAFPVCWMLCTTQMSILLHNKRNRQKNKCECKGYSIKYMEEIKLQIKQKKETFSCLKRSKH